MSWKDRATIVTGSKAGGSGLATSDWKSRAQANTEKDQKNWDKGTGEGTDNPILAALSSAGSAMNFGLTDEAQGGIGALVEGFKHITGQDTYKDLKGQEHQRNKNFTEALTGGYTRGRDSEREVQRLLQENSPIASTVGMVSGSLAPLGSAAVRGADLVKYGLSAGALGGFGNSNANLGDVGLLTDTALSAGVGGITGGVFKHAPTAIEDMAQKIKESLILKSMGTSKGALKALGENSGDVAETAIKAGAVRPFQGIESKLSKLEQFKKGAGKSLEDMRVDAPNIAREDVTSIINRRAGDLNPNIHTDAPKIKQVEQILQDIDNLYKGSDGKVNLKQLIDLKGSYGEASRKGFGEVNPAKEILDSVGRGGLRELEMANLGTPAYMQAAKDYSTSSVVKPILENLRAQSGANSLLSLGGGVISGGVGATTQDPQLAALAYFMATPAMRRQMAAGGAQGIQALQQAIKLLPKLPVGGAATRLPKE